MTTNNITDLSYMSDIKTLFKGTNYVYDEVPSEKITLYDLIIKTDDVLKAYKELISRNILLPFLNG